AASHLIPLLNDDDQWVRKSAAKALGLLRAEAAVTALQGALDDPSELVQKNARRSLDQIREQGS
ncbi:MAG: HEAT repeat domain-containing protein, partial [Desulfuromonadales bacterium]|nr:HEAT repeat domain-containing protein [Desulfuromonadales bacterium]NIS39812.1 HEAT repeat domain-containing protein [Desulfuromonadales bacterium]